MQLMSSVNTDAQNAGGVTEFVVYIGSKCVNDSYSFSEGAWRIGIAAGAMEECRVKPILAAPDMYRPNSVIVSYISKTSNMDFD